MSSEASAPGSGWVTVQTPAKINLSLAVGAPRDDGFHPVATVYQAVSVFDVLSAGPAPEGEVGLEVLPAPGSARAPQGVPADDRNLAVRAARLLADRTGVRAGVRLRLRKEVPVAGGMAGGSADAAAALVACNALWGTGLGVDDLLVPAAELGSDVPFCLLGGTAVGRGRGEQLSPVPVSGSCHWVLVPDERGLSTPAVYAELDRLRAAAPGPVGVDVPEALLDALARGDCRALGEAMCNDLQAAALSLRPELADVLGSAEAVGARRALVSGSGPTCVLLADDADAAGRVRDALAAAGRRAVVAVGPVPGARVVDAWPG